MAVQVLYKAKVACRVGGAFRRAGEVFPLPEFEATPPFLTRADEEPEAPEEPPKKAPRKPKATAPGPMPKDLPGVERD